MKKIVFFLNADYLKLELLQVFNCETSTKHIKVIKSTRCIILILIISEKCNGKQKKRNIVHHISF